MRRATGWKVATITGCLALTMPIAGSVSTLASSPEPSLAPAEQTVRDLNISLRRLADRHAFAPDAVTLAALEELAATRRALLADLAGKDPALVTRVALASEARARLPESVRRHVEQFVSLEGTLSEIFETGSESCALRYELRDAPGVVYDVRFADEFASPVPDGNVQLSGIALPTAEPSAPKTESGLLVVYSGPSADFDPTGAPDTVAVSGLTEHLGAQRTLVVLVNFEDTATDRPFTVFDADQAVFGTVNDFFVESSFGKTSLTGVADGWFTLPMVSTCSTTSIAEAADEAAVAAGHDLASYDRFVYIFEGAVSCSWAGSATGGSSPPTRAFINGSLDTQVIAHELGHNFGLRHSNFLECGAEILGASCQSRHDDNFDAMGTPDSLAHSNAFQKERLDWLEPGDVLTVSTDGDYEIEPFELPGDATPKIVKILKETTAEGNEWYFIEYRQALGFDSWLTGNENVLNGVLIHIGKDYQDNSIVLLDMTPESNLSEYSDRRDTALIVGVTYDDPDAGFTLTTTWADTTGAGIRVSFGGPSCVRANPSVSVSPSTSPALSQGSSYAYDVTVTNEDSSACSAADFLLSATAPAGWSAFADPSVVTLAPGTSATATLDVTSSASAADGSYPVDVLVEHGSDASLTGSARATFVVKTQTINSPPVARDDSATTSSRTAVTIDVLANDSDPDGDPLRVSDVGVPAQGAATLNADGTITYTPGSKARGEDSFTYAASDGSATSSAVVTVTIEKSSGGGGGGKGRKPR